MSRTARVLLGFVVLCVGLGVLSAGVNAPEVNGGFAAAGVIMMGLGIVIAFER